MTVVVDLYTIQIIAQDNAVVYDVVRDRVAAAVAETEENLIDLLPPGYRAQIRRWDEPYPDEGNQDE